MAYAITDILRAQVTTKVVSRMAQSTSRILNQYNMAPGQSQELPVGHREAGYDVFNHSRAVGTTSAPGAPATRITPQIVGRVNFTFARLNEELFLPYEKIHNLRQVGGSAAQFDQLGANYITLQERFMGERVANWRTILLIGMLRGGLYAHQSGDKIYFDYNSANALYQVDLKMPAGNMSQLNMLGGGNLIDVSWSNPGADIPAQLEAIDQALMQLCGQRLERITCSGRLWSKYVLKNDAVQAGAGIANKPWETYRREVGVGPDGTPITDKFGVIAAVPWVEWHITNDGLDVGAPGATTWTQHVPDTNIFFGPNPAGRNDLFEMQLGDEPVVEYENGPVAARMGLYTWTKRSDNPAGYEFFALDNAMPASYVPACHGNGTVVF